MTSKRSKPRIVSPDRLAVCPSCHKVDRTYYVRSLELSYRVLGTRADRVLVLDETVAPDGLEERRVLACRRCGIDWPIDLPALFTQEWNREAVL